MNYTPVDLSTELMQIKLSLKALAEISPADAPKPQERLERWLTRNNIAYPPNSTANRILWVLDDSQVIKLSKALQGAILRERENERSQKNPVA